MELAVAWQGPACGSVAAVAAPIPSICRFLLRVLGR